MQKSKGQQDQPHQITIDAQIRLNETKDQIVIQNNKIKQTIQHFSHLTYIILSINLNPSKLQIMNINVYEDIMSYIANYINQQDLNLVMSLSSNEKQIESKFPIYTLKYQIIMPYQKQEQQKLQSLEQILIHLGDKLEQISIQTYLNGDQNLDNELQILLNQYMNIL